jgi:hypothetical protein
MQAKPLEGATVQRKCAACEQETTLQRQAEPEEEELMQAKPLMRASENGTATATPQLTSQLNGSKGGGQSLPKDTLSSMNHIFGTDFSSVRVHTGSRAQEMSQGIQAKAFTHGSDVYFNRGQYNPGSTEGKRLLGHELTHVVQQGGSRDGNLISRDWLDSAIPAEEDFWGDLRQALATELDNYLGNIHGQGVNRWIIHMNSGSESGTGNLAINILKSAVGLLPRGGGITSAIIGGVQDIYNYIDDKTPSSNLIGFNNFVTLQSDARTDFSKKISHRSHEMFSAVETLRSQENDSNRSEIRQQALNEARLGRSSLPSDDRVYRSLVQAWVRGAQDSWDNGDWGAENAGYIYATCDFFYGGAGFGNFRAFVDDVERPEGVIETIRQGWNSVFNLDELPFAMTVTISERRDTGTNRGFRKTGETRLQKQFGDNPLTLVSGSERLRIAYMSKARRINASHLVVD